MSWVVSEKDKKVYGRREKKLLKPRAPLQISEDERWLGTPSRHAWTIPQEIADNILIWRSANLSGPSTDKMVEVGLKNDIMWLRNTLLQSSFKHSGQRVVNIPHQWNRSRQCYTVSFCNNIGLHCAISSEQTCLEISAVSAAQALAGLTTAELMLKLCGSTISGQEARSCAKDSKQALRSESPRRQRISDHEANKRVPARSWLDGLRRDIVGAWLTGETHLGRLIAEGGAEARGGACVVDLRASREGGIVALFVVIARAGIARTLAVAVQGMVSAEAVVAAASGAWPEGIIIRGLCDDFYLPAQLVQVRLPEVSEVILPRAHKPILPISAWVKVLKFSGEWVLASSACFGLARAVEFVSSEALRSLISRADPVAARHVFPFGSFLAEGSFKKVYAVDRQAVGIINLSLGDGKTDTPSKTSKELEISCLLTQLILRRCCPNFVNLVDAFIGEYQPCNKVSHCPRLRLYACMGLCDNGDTENWLRKQVNQILPEDTTLQLFFQLCFAVYVSRAVIGLRHYDLKLLNLLVSPLESNATAARYHLGIATFDIHLRQDKLGAWMKLADFGTSHSGSATLGRPTWGALLTTIENAPLDILFGGDPQDTHAFAHDTFSLGLAALHLFGGDAPYEELMLSCFCPDNLSQALAAFWYGSSNTIYSATVLSASYRIDNSVCVPLDDTLFDTFYRLLVLLGIPSYDDDTISKLGPGAATILQVARACLLRNPKIQQQVPSKHKRAQQQFAKHSYIFNLQTGVNPAIRRCRQRLGPNLDVLRAMLDLDPRKRPTMRAILSSSLFTSLKLTRGVYDISVLDELDWSDARQPIPDV